MGSGGTHEGAECRASALGLRFEDLEFAFEGSGFRVEGLGFGV